MLALMFIISACSDNSLLNEKQAQQAKEEISKIDGKPIIKFNAADLYHTDRFNKYVQMLALKDGPAIMHALKEKSASLKKHQMASVAVKALKDYATPSLTGSKSGGSPTSSAISNLANVGSELQMKDSDGDIEKFVMTLQPYVPHPGKESSGEVVKRMVSGKANGSSGEDTYLALDPDFFYIHDDVNSEENYPISFPAVSLTNSSKKIMVTLTRKPNGKVVFHFHQPTITSGESNSVTNTTVSQPNLIFATAIPILHTNYLEPSPGGGGGGGGGGSAPCASVYGSGGPTAGSSITGNTFINLYDLHLWANAEGGSKDSEIQMFIEQNDDYDQCLPKKYRYRFDFIITNLYYDLDGNYHPVYSTADRAADNKTYFTPDVNDEGVTYSFTNIDRVEFEPPVAHQPGRYVVTGHNKGFPLFDLTDEPGPWRLVLSENDKSYNDFSVHKGNSNLDHGVYVEDIHTYNMSSDNWSEVSTGFTPHKFNHGNSDDPVRESGARQITLDNFNSNSQYKPGVGDVVQATKYYPNRGLYFRYVWGLQVK